MSFLRHLLTIALTGALATISPAAATETLQVGDILLQPLSCWSCSLIEAEEETRFSHIGIVLRTDPEPLVAEAFEKVRLVSFAEFDKKTEEGQSLKILRFKNEAITEALTHHQQKWLTIFRSDFENNPYDTEFLWNNFSPSGKEKLYCSELVSKLLNSVIGVDLPIKRMHFEKNRDAWTRFFKGKIPDGQWGNSPGDYERSDLFRPVHLEVSSKRR